MIKPRAGEIVGTTPLLRFRDLKERKIVNNRATLSNWIKREGFPPGRMLGPNTRIWDEPSVLEWVNNRPVPNSAA
jgi:predicted DNA-binding transcriptional regulator AlpA